MTDTIPDNSPQATTVDLNRPIRRGDQEISRITLAKPKGGALRGLNIQALVQTDYNALRTLVPRIATPQVLETDLDAMEADDLAEIGGAVVGFFMSQATKAAIWETFGTNPTAQSTG